MTATVAHFERNAAPRFVESTIEVDMSALPARFLAQVPDSGCSTGWLVGLADIESVECWRREAPRPERSETWLNALVKRRLFA